MAVCCRTPFLRLALRQVAVSHYVSISSRERAPLYSTLMAAVNYSRLPSRPYSSSSIRHQVVEETGRPERHEHFDENPDEILQSLNPEMEKRLKVIKLEYDVYLHMGDPVAEKVTPGMWVKLLQCETKSARKRLHKYFRSCEKHDLARARKKLVKQKLREERERMFESGELEKTQLNTIMLKLRKRTMLKYYNSKLAHAMMFGSPLIIDLGFEESMQPREIVNLSEQIMNAHGFNKTHKEPFHMIFCNAKKSSETLRVMQGQTAYLPLEKFMFTITEQSYLDLYPRDQLVYLSPHASEVMRNYDHNKVYIVGGIVDKHTPKPFTLAKAKREGIAMAKLPLDYFHRWEKGTKSLTIDQMVKILLDIQMTQDWHTALSHIPTRKLVTNSRQ